MNDIQHVTPLRPKISEDVGEQV